MPRIKAATVPEHREAQRDALLRAAKSLLLEHGVSALRFTDVADRAGVARPSVYDYFPTKTALLVALVDAEFPRWTSEVVQSMESAEGAGERLAAFVRTHVRLASDGRHELAFVLGRGDLEPEVRLHVEKAHAELGALLETALRSLGVRRIPEAVAFVMGVIGSAVGRVERGADTSALAMSAVAFVLGGVDALRAPKRPRANAK